MVITLKQALDLYYGKNNYTLIDANENQILGNQAINCKIAFFKKNTNKKVVGYMIDAQIDKYQFRCKEKGRLINFEEYIKKEYYINSTNTLLISDIRGFYNKDIPSDALIPFNKFKENKLKEYLSKYEFINDNIFCDNSYENEWTTKKHYKRVLLKAFGKEYYDDYKNYCLEKNIEISKATESNQEIL